MNHWCVYILECSDKGKSLYTGMTSNLLKRLIAHQSGKGAKFTRGRGPLTILASFLCDSKSSALKLEYKIKQLSRASKLELCNEAAISTNPNTGKLLRSLQESD